MKPLDGIVVSIKKELEAMQMYTQLANLSTDTEQKLLFSELANMESGHKARLRICTPTWPSLKSGRQILKIQRMLYASTFFFFVNYSGNHIFGSAAPSKLKYTVVALFSQSYAHKEFLHRSGSG